MEINVRNKVLMIKDDLLKEMNKRFIKVDATACEHYIELAYAVNTGSEYVPADLDVIFATKTESELSDAVNRMIEKELGAI